MQYFDFCWQKHCVNIAGWYFPAQCLIPTRSTQPPPHASRDDFTRIETWIFHMLSGQNGMPSHQTVFIFTHLSLDNAQLEQAWSVSEAEQLLRRLAILLHIERWLIFNGKKSLGKVFKKITTTKKCISGGKKTNSKVVYSSHFSYKVLALQTIDYIQVPVNGQLWAVTPCWGCIDITAYCKMFVSPMVSWCEKWTGNKGRIGVVKSTEFSEILDSKSL